MCVPEEIIYNLFCPYLIKKSSFNIRNSVSSRSLMKKKKKCSGAATNEQHNTKRLNMNRCAVICDVQQILPPKCQQNATRMQEVDDPCLTERESHSLSLYPVHYDVLCIICPPSSSDAWQGSAWQPVSGWHWPTAQPCVWSSASSSGTPHVVTSHGKAPQSWSGPPPAHAPRQRATAIISKRNNIMFNLLSCCLL